MIWRGTLRPAARQAAKDAEKLMAMSGSLHGALRVTANYFTGTWGTTLRRAAREDNGVRRR